jgi:hypothetical protein
MNLGLEFARVSANMAESPQPLGFGGRASLLGRNSAGEDALMQVQPIRNVSKFSLPIR